MLAAIRLLRVRRIVILLRNMKIPPSFRDILRLWHAIKRPCDISGERACRRGAPEHFQAKWVHLATRKMRSEKHAFSSQVDTLGDSENATRNPRIFKPSGFTWRLGKCDQKITCFQAKWVHSATRKMRPENHLFSSQVGSLGGSENTRMRRSRGLGIKWPQAL
jgi:hypothetical protein